QLLEMMGTSGRDQGALRAEDLPAALDRLKAALSQRPDSDETDPDADEDDEADAVSINRRAVPVLDLLERCVASGGYFMWQEKR
ncbi:MAG: DUF1840 family protein, partial [Pseudomonadota bacterium]